jgi:hypothetical protein
VTRVGVGLQLLQQASEDGQRDWQFSLGVPLAVVVFDPADEPLNDWGSAGVEREVEIGMHRFDVSEVLFDSPRLNVPCEA